MERSTFFHGKIHYFFGNVYVKLPEGNYNFTFGFMAVIGIVRWDSKLKKHNELAGPRIVPSHPRHGP